MPRAKRRRGGGPPPRRRQGGQQPAAAAQEVINEGVALLEQGQFVEAIMTLEQARQEHPREPAPNKLLGLAYSEVGMFDDAIERWEEASRLDPDDPYLWRLLAGAYGQQGYFAHAVRALRRFAAMPEEDEDTAELEAAREELERALAETSRSLGVPMAEVERGTVLLERALRATSGGDYLNAMRLARDAGRVLPNWPPPQNTLAFAQFQLGKGDEAVAIAERALAAHPDDVHALANLARFLTTLGRRDEALRYGDRLWSVLQGAGPAAGGEESTVDTFDREKAAEAFAILEQDDRVVGALERLPRDAVSDFGLILLGAALANLRRKGEALQVLEELQPNPGAARIAEALRRNETPPGGRFIALGPADLVPAGLMDRVLARLPRPAGGVGGEEADRAAVAAVLAQAPTFMPACMVSLWLTDEVTSAQTVDLLLTLRTPEGVEAVRTFAFGRLGPDETRLYAALALRQAGLVDAGRGLLLWQDGRYQELYPPRYRLIEADDAGKRPYPPAASKQMAKAVARHEAGDLEGAARLYRQVLAQDPTIEDAEQHLGLIDLMQGDRDAAEGHFARAFELNPDFVLARCTLASLRIGQRRLSEARDLLVPLADRTEFTPGELAAYLFTSAELAAADGDPARARGQLRLLLAYVPEHVPARLRLRELEQAEASRQAEGQGQGPGSGSLIQPPTLLRPR